MASTGTHKDVLQCQQFAWEAFFDQSIHFPLVKKQGDCQRETPVSTALNLVTVKMHTGSETLGQMTLMLNCNSML